MRRRAWHRCLLIGAPLLALSLTTLACSNAPAPNTGLAASAARGTPARTSNEPDCFEDVTPGSGMAFTYRNGEEAGLYTMLETLGGGVALIDYDGDGLLDVFFTGGGYFGPQHEIRGYPGRLFRNEGNWRFRDVTATAGLDQAGFYTHGVAVGDYNNDAWPDLLVTGYGRLALFRNQQGKFEDVTEMARLRTPLAASSPAATREGTKLHWSTSAAWADLNGDGHLDLFVCHYLDWSFQNHPFCKGHRSIQPRGTCSPKMFQPLPQALFLNQGDGTFRDATTEAGIQVGRGLGILVFDADDNGLPDVYVANDLLNNQLYLNQGGGRFTEVGVAAGVATGEGGNPDGSMGVDAADYDGSGRFSLFVTNFEREAHALYRCQAKGLFKHHSVAAGITAIGLDYVGWGTGFIDLENDGVEDLFFSNGHVETHPEPPATVAQKPVLLRNLRRSGRDRTMVTFREITASGGPYFRQVHRGRGVAFGDLDNDGRVDLVISHVNEPVTLLRNVAGQGHHWLGVRLIGNPCPDAVGAKLTLEVGDQKLVRTIKGGGSYLSSNDRRVVFGLGAHSQPCRLTVSWANGRSQRWENLPIDRYTACRLNQRAN